MARIFRAQYRVRERKKELQNARKLKVRERERELVRRGGQKWVGSQR